MATYQSAGREIEELIAEVVSQYHPELRDAEVTIGALVAFAPTDKNGDKKGPALKHGGYPAAATIKITNLRDRASGLPDCRIVIDGDRWDTWSRAEKASLLDHEVTHLELAVEDDGAVSRDDLDRPKLRIRLHDHQFGFFDADPVADTDESELASDRRRARSLNGKLWAAGR